MESTCFSGTVGPFLSTPYRVAELWQPTLGDGETYTDLLADRSAWEDYDADAVGARGYGFVRLNQLAVEHLTGVH